ncbi:hypothetical protein [Paraburkholderia humisilvae]|uniref:Acid shock protein n=1 Tax=Paraburkholderia humisilvae TaxID=627669 RepID=A0A6J5E0S6_9BURK|nr:hypothetical protein [Paraburkholderia humisilvae]CAB3758752.1 hypothetical protein LMG29542_03421 [Paraburkholderia humisilvae]
MNGLKLKLPLATVASAVLLLSAFALASGTASAQNAPTQHAPSPDMSASMVKPPADASGGSNNPDNMPVKKPRKPTNDKMMHSPPASATNAK